MSTIQQHPATCDCDACLATLDALFDHECPCPCGCGGAGTCAGLREQVEAEARHSSYWEVEHAARAAGAGVPACTGSIDCGCPDCEAVDWYALGRALCERRYPTLDEDLDTNRGDVPY